MTEGGELVWTAQRRERAGAGDTQLFLDPAMGLTDVNFHRVTDAGWENLRREGGAATLTVSPSATLEALQGALAELRTRGGFSAVEIFIRSPS
jgi:hypothetical protein